MPNPFAESYFVEFSDVYIKDAMGAKKKKVVKKKPASKSQLGAVMKAAIAAAMKVAKKAILPPMKVALPPAMKAGRPPKPAGTAKITAGKPLKGILKTPANSGPLVRDKRSGRYVKSPSPARPEINYDTLAKQLALQLGKQQVKKKAVDNGSSILPGKVDDSDSDEAKDDVSSVEENEPEYLNLSKNGASLKKLLATEKLPLMCDLKILGDGISANALIQITSAGTIEKHGVLLEAVLLHCDSKLGTQLLSPLFANNGRCGLLGF